MNVLSASKRMLDFEILMGVLILIFISFYFTLNNYLFLNLKIHISRNRTFYIDIDIIILHT